MQRFRGARWVGPPAGPRVLLLSAEPISGQRWVYTYSITPGRTVSLVTMPGPGMLPPDHPDYATIVADLTREPP